MQDFETFIRGIVREEMNNYTQKVVHVPAQQFCKDRNISRTKLWRDEKKGIVKVDRIGRKVFVNLNQFS